MNSKSEQRAEIKDLLARINEHQHKQAAESIRTHLLTDPAITRAKTILAYAAFGSELSLDPFITAALEAGKTVCIPRTDWDTKAMSPVAITNLHTDLESGRYGIRVPADGCAPIDPAQLDVILLPGLGFDRAGNRLGRGAGFYDRFISSLHDAGHRPTLIGVCHGVQVIESVPTEPHDHRVDRVITEHAPLDPV